MIKPKALLVWLSKSNDRTAAVAITPVPDTKELAVVIEKLNGVDPTVPVKVRFQLIKSVRMSEPRLPSVVSVP
jgi:hypothetical protein